MAVMNELKPRNALAFLRGWRERSTRRPLVLRGARQVGKSSLVRLFAREFSLFVELNLEHSTNRRFFDGLPPVRQLVEWITLQPGYPGALSRVLLFIDEVQESPDAIQQMRYLYEEVPELRVIAAGSLLELALGDVGSFPVGRVELYTLHPLTFDEYLDWTGRAALGERARHPPVSDVAHDELLAEFHRYALIGGMPSVVAASVAGASLNELGPLYQGMWGAYVADAERYARGRKQREVLRHVLSTAPLVDDRVVLAGFAGSNYRSEEVGAAFDALGKAGVVRLIYPSTAVEPPLTTERRRRPRLQLLDTGLLNAVRGIQADLLEPDYLSAAFRSHLVLHVVTQEIIARHHESDWVPHFWVRERAGSSAEVDLLLEDGRDVVGLEVKAGPQGHLRSLHQLVERASSRFAIRLLRNRYSVQEARTPGGHEYSLVNMPYYGAFHWPRYLDQARASASR